MANIDAPEYIEGYQHGQQAERNRAKHNGFSNYETWCVSLWIDNDQGSQEYWSEAAGSAKEAAEADGEEATAILADRLKDEFEEAAPELQGFWADMMNAALGEVDWHEVAEHLLAE